MYHVANVFLSKLELLWSISRAKISKISKTCVFGEKLQSQLGKQQRLTKLAIYKQLILQKK